MGLRGKFSQNSTLLKYLGDTHQLRLGEASRDPKWGIGMSLEDKEALDPAKWLPSGNLLGRALTKIRDEFFKTTIHHNLSPDHPTNNTHQVEKEPEINVRKEYKDKTTPKATTVNPPKDTHQMEQRSETRARDDNSDKTPSTKPELANAKTKKDNKDKETSKTATEKTSPHPKQIKDSPPIDQKSGNRHEAKPTKNTRIKNNKEPPEDSTLTTPKDTKNNGQKTTKENKDGKDPPDNKNTRNNRKEKT